MREATIRYVPLALLLVIAGLVPVASAQTLPIHAGTRVIRSGDLIAEIGDPASADLRWNQGLRFSPVANVLRLQLEGQEFLYSPVGGGSVGWLGGLPMEFDIGQEAFQPDPPGYNEASNGDPFLKIGVGILTRNSSAYNFSSSYPVIELAQTSATWHADRVRFVQTLTGTANGYSYRLEEDVIVKNDRLIMNYRLENTGTKEFTTEQYLHNFMTFSNTPVGPDYRLYFPYDFTASPDVEPWAPPVSRTRAAANPSVVRLGNVIAYLERLSGVPKTWIYKPEDYMGRDIFALEHTGTGQCMVIETTAPTPYTGIWTTDYQISPEQFIMLTLAPGESTTFSRTYVVSANRALPADNTGEGFVDASDLSTLSAAWLSEPGTAQWEPACDIAAPMDDTIDLDDLAALAAQWKRDALGPVPVAHWRLDEIEGLLAADSAGGHAGTLRGFGNDNEQWAAGQIGGGLVLDGVDDFVEIEGSAGLCGRRPRTVTAWVKTAERSSAAMTVIAWGSQEAGQGFALEIDPAGRFKVTADGGSAVAGDQLVGDKRWHHVAAVLAPLEHGTPRMSDLRLYVDGRRQNLYGLVEADIETACDTGIRIGASYDADESSAFSGIIDDIQVFDIPLSARNVADLSIAADI